MPQNVWKQVAALLAIALLNLYLSQAHASNKVEVETDNGTYFRVDDKRVSADQAVSAYKSGKDVEKCTAVKGAVDEHGDAVSASKCKLQKRVLSARTGNETWKAK
jgi:hypothetical protein